LVVTIVIGGLVHPYIGIFINNIYVGTV